MIVIWNMNLFGVVVVYKFDIIILERWGNYNETNPSNFIK